MVPRAAQAQPDPAPAAALVREGSFRPLTVAMGASVGLQPDSRQCGLAGSVGSNSPAAACVMFAGGVDLSLLYRGRLGGTVGLFSVSGQAIQGTVAAPDRVSIPFLFDVRPLGFLVPRGDTSYKGRLLTGLGLALGPSVEVIRISSDSTVNPGLVVRLQAELPLHAQPRNGVSLRFAAHTVVSPAVALYSGGVRTTPFECVPATCAGVPLGLDAVFQAYFGLVYYP